MRMIVAAAVALIAFTGVARAGFDDPKAVVVSLFEPYGRGQQPVSLDSYYTDALKLMFAKYRQQAGVDMGTRIEATAAASTDFDPFVNARHYLLFDLAIGDPVISNDRAMVTVSYKNFDHPTELAVSLRRDSNGWKIDDVASLGADDHWLLSWLLTYDPTGVH